MPTDAVPSRPRPGGSSRTGGFELCVFDVAGTTVEEHQAVYRSLAEAVTAAGVRLTDAELADWMGADKREAITALLTGRGEAPGEQEVSRVYADFRGRLLAAYEQTPPEPLPGVEQAIHRLRDAGVQVALTTGFTREVTDLLLGVLRWSDGVVDAVVCAEEVGAGRPAPFMIFEAMRRTGVLAVDRVAVAGDTRLDLAAGMNAGAALVAGVLTGAEGASALGAVPHTHLLGSVVEIPDLVLLP